MPLAVVPNCWLGSANAYLLIDSILGRAYADGTPFPHPNRDTLAPFAMQHLHPQVTDIGDRVLLELSDWPEYRGYRAPTNTFGHEDD